MAGLTLLGAVFASQPALAHGVSEAAQQRMIDGGVFDFAWAGAEHMLTGYDHLLFLLGVLFVLPRFLDILKFATVFTLGHTITLLGATRLGVRIDHYAIDAFIALTVLYVGIQNLGGFRVLTLAPPPLLPLVFLFGLIHGLGLSTGIQEMTLPGAPGLMAKLLAFNLGVECGQVAALVFMSAVLRLWRASPAWLPLKQAISTGLIAGAGVLFALQIHGFVTAAAPPPPLHHHTA